MNKKIGFIGLGIMGKWIALNIMSAGFDLMVFDISSDAMRSLTDKGAKPARTPADLAGKVDWVFLSLPDTAAVEKVIFGEDGIVKGARAGLIVVDFGTTGYLPTQEFNRKLKEQGITFADAPVSGAEPGAQKGTLTVMFGGDESTFNLVYPLLKAMSRTILHMGPVGSGQLTKVVNNLLYNINLAAMAEVLPMAVKLGLDPEKISQVITTGTSRSFAAEYFTPYILENRFDHAYALNNAYKDMVSAAEISAYHKIPMPLVHAATTTYQMALAEGYGHEDKGAMIKVFERLLGVKFRRISGGKE